MAMQVASLFGVLTLDDSQFRRGLQGAQGQLDDFGGRLRNVGGQVQRVGIGLTAAALPLAGMGYAAIRTAGDFQTALQQLSVRTGIVGDDLQQVADYAQQMGATTVFSSRDAIGAMLELTASGQSLEQAYATLPHVLDLAAVSGEDLGYVADLVTDSLAMFGLEADQAGIVVNALSAAASSSSADVGSLAEGLANVGPVAAQFGMSAEETIATLALFAENSIKGAEAGTQLRSMLLNMTSTTTSTQGAWDALGTSFYDAQGNARPLNDIFGDITTAMKDMPAQQQNELMAALAGSYGILGASALTSGMTIDQMTANMQAQTDAATVADSMMGGYAGTMSNLEGSLETLGIVLGETVIPLITDLINNQVVPVINAFGEWAKQNPETAQTLMLVVGGAVVLGPLVTALGTAISVMGTVASVASSAIGLLSGGMMGAIGPILLVGSAIAGVIAAIHEFNRLTNEAASNANQAISPMLQSGQLSPEQLREAAFAETAAQFGGGIAGDIAARLLYENVARGAETGEFHLVDTRPQEGRASGGPVVGGQPYMVGERGPEMFVPGMSGSIVPNESLGGMNIGPIYITANDAAGGRAAGDAFANRLSELIRARGL